MADNHSDTIWAQGWMSVVRPMSRLGTLAFKVPIKVPALGTVGLQGSAMFKQKMLRAAQVPMQEFICDLRFRHLKV